MTSSLAASGPCARSVHPVRLGEHMESRWGRGHRPGRAPLGLVLAAVVGVAPPLSRVLSFLHRGRGWWWWWQGCLLISRVVLMLKKSCISVKISLCLFGNWYSFSKLPDWLWCSSTCPFSWGDKTSGCLAVPWAWFLFAIPHPFVFESAFPKSLFLANFSPGRFPGCEENVQPSQHKCHSVTLGIKSFSKRVG